MGTRSISAEARWRRIIQEQVDSGQTVAEFCRNRGTAASSLFAWKRRLKRNAGASVFVEARLRPGDDVVNESRRAGSIEIHLGRQRRLVVQAGFDPAMLNEVVRALEGLDRAGTEGRLA